MKNLTILWLLCTSLAHAQRMDSTQADHPKQKLYILMKDGDQSRDRGDLAEAEKNYLAAAQVAEPLIRQHAKHRSIFGGTIFDAYDRLGYLYLVSNNPVKAEKYFQESKRLRNENLPRRSVFRAHPVVGLAEVALKQNENDKARTYLLEGEKILNRSMTSFYSPEVLYKNILFNKAELYFRIHDYKQLKKILPKLFSGGTVFALESDLGVRAQIPRVFEIQGRYLLETGDLRQAEEFLTKARKYSKALGTRLNDFRIMRTEALLLWKKSDIEGAGKKFHALTESYKNFVAENFVAMSEHEKENFFLNLKADFDLFNAFILENSNDPQVSQFYSWAYDNQLFSKALLLNESSKIKNAILNGNDESLKQNLREWEVLKAELSAAYFQKKKIDDISGLQAKIESLERTLNQGSDLLKAYSRIESWRDVGAALNPNEAAIEVVRVTKFDIAKSFTFTDSVQYLILKVTKDAPSPEGFVISKGNALETKYLSYYRNCINARIDDTVSYNVFWKPVSSHLRSTQRVYFSPDGSFTQINPSTLQNPVSRQYLLDEIDFVLVTNTKDLLTKFTAEVSKKASLYGRPDYKLDITNTAGEFLRATTTRAVRSETLDDFRNQTFTDLPATEDEVNKVAALFKSGGWTVSTKIDEDASESNLKSEQGPPVLHIATHGFFLGQKSGEDINSMIRSGVILAGVNNEQATNGGNDGVLTAYEATSLNLTGTDLVTLSACETGLGESKNGVGVYGLQRGFIVAGAHHVLMSLWKVDDTSTDLLMQEFYSSWIGGDEIHDALKKAQRTIMKKYPQPYYWGAFVLLGK